ncbi:hypothetical protein DERP_015294 [Dermatophagoides pteronyssinus]|uniref:Uncharacterized protein n=1 Tax=Dermatophagoides pteronyssinus TaxID=6956 RepID=A0ABQ8J5R6_DERPT|nr:hypothetical protein DERP_015294 [Dermatophagoides pteronyssinus]
MKENLNDDVLNLKRIRFEYCHNQKDKHEIDNNKCETFYAVVVVIIIDNGKDEPTSYEDLSQI